MKGEKLNQTRNLSIKEIAKLIKKELKTITNGKVSVTTRSGTFTSTIWVEISNYSEDMDQLRLKANAIGNAYNYDNSNVLNDYFDTRFYYIVNL